MAKGPKRNRPPAKKGHRAHKKDSVMIPPAKEGQGRDARRAARRCIRPSSTHELSARRPRQACL